MQALCFALFACAFNLLIGYVGLLSFGHALFFGWASYVAPMPPRSGACTPELAILAGTATAALLGPGRRRARDPPPGHLFRHDHAGAGADDVLLLPCRRRSPAARTASRRCRAARCSASSICTNDDRHVFRRAGDLPGRLPADLPHHPFAVRRGAEGDPRERAARDLARLQRPTATSCSPSCCRRRSPASPARPRRSCSSSPR